MRSYSKKFDFDETCTFAIEKHFYMNILQPNGCFEFTIRYNRIRFIEVHSCIELFR